MDVKQKPWYARIVNRDEGIICEEKYKTKAEAKAFADGVRAVNECGLSVEDDEGWDDHFVDITDDNHSVDD